VSEGRTRMVTLTEAQLEHLADLVAERLREEPTEPPARLVGARELAERLDVDPKSVYRHAADLGGVQVGRAWRFDLDRALAAWGADRSASERPQPSRTPAATGSPSRRRRTTGAPHCQLLPVGHDGSSSG
jgi:hypothetical protein